jgi:hypothetical protein
MVLEYRARETIPEIGHDNMDSPPVPIRLS